MARTFLGPRPKSSASRSPSNAAYASSSASSNASSSMRRALASSSTRKPALTPADSKCARKSSAQKPWMVVMVARSRRTDCSSSAPLASISRRASLARSSEAAARVNVTMSISSMFAPSASNCITRSTSTVVLPEPAAAATSKFSPRDSMAARCSCVNGMVPPQWFSIPPSRLRRATSLWYQREAFGQCTFIR